MGTKIISEDGTKVKMEVDVDIDGSLLDAEEAIEKAIQKAKNAVILEQQQKNKNNKTF